MFDTTRSYFNDLREMPLAPSASVAEEGQCLVLVSDGAGGLGAQPSAGAGSELFCGFAITDAKKVLTEVVVETFNVPAVAPYQVTLKNANIITTEVRVYDNTTSAALTVTCPTPGAAQYCVTTAGLASFNAAQAGDSITITYRYTLTAAQIIDKFHQRNVNNTAQDYFSTVAVGCLQGEIFTSMFDASQAYAAAGTIYSGAAGKVTSAAGGATVGVCSKVPSAADPFLGVKFKTVA